MGGDIDGESSLETVLAAVSIPAVLTNNLTSNGQPKICLIVEHLMASVRIHARLQNQNDSIML
jgi:hypothetical protein